MVRTVMAEFQLVRFPAQRKPAHLMAKANSKHGDAAEKLAHVLHGVIHWLRIARAVRKKNAVRTHSQNILGRSFCWHHADFAVMIVKQSQNVFLDSTIVGQDSD